MVDYKTGPLLRVSPLLIGPYYSEDPPQSLSYLQLIIYEVVTDKKCLKVK